MSHPVDVRRIVGALTGMHACRNLHHVVLTAARPDTIFERGILAVWLEFEDDITAIIEYVANRFFRDVALCGMIDYEVDAIVDRILEHDFPDDEWPSDTQEFDS